MANSLKLSGWCLLVILCLAPFSRAAESEEIEYEKDNAAYWYFKAFELYKKTDEVDLSKFLDNEQKLTPEIREFVKKQKPVIEMIVKASKMKHCDWKYDTVADIWLYKRMKSNSTGKPFTLLLLADARLKEAKNNYSAVIDHCEIIFRFSSQLENREPISFLTSAGCRQKCYQYIIDFLNRNPDIDLKYLKAVNEILKRKNAFQEYLLGDILKYKLECAETALKDIDSLDNFYKDPMSAKFLEFDKENSRKKLAESCLTLYRKYINDLQNALKVPVFGLLKIKEVSDYYDDEAEKFLNYVTNFQENQKPSLKDYKKFTTQFGYLFVSVQNVMATPVYYFQIKSKTQLHALKTALPILIEYRKTGKLPATVPADSPLDMFSNTYFQLIKDKDLFTLKCKGYDMKEKKFHSFEFKLPSEN